ncbi:hypothetical protein ACWGPT_05215 [Pseudorhizobium sp. NPDC055634]
MAAYENIANSPFPSGGKRARGLALHPLHEAAMRLAGAGLTRSKDRTRDLVALLLSHGSRAWRHSQPQVRIHLHVGRSAGHLPVRLRVN